MEKVKWPEGKKSAVMFSFDLDGDVIWRNMSSDEPNAEKLIRARSIGQYGPNRCVDMILDLMEKYGVKATFYVPGFVAEHNPDVIRRIADAGHEMKKPSGSSRRLRGKSRQAFVPRRETGMCARRISYQRWASPIQAPCAVTTSRITRFLTEKNQTWLRFRQNGSWMIM